VLSLVVKVTTRCNSNCRYCLLRGVERRSMEESTLDTLFERIGEHLEADLNGTVEILWHGGEPLLRGADFFRRARDLSHSQLGDALPRLRQSMQTNLTALDEELLELLGELDIRSLGTSFDPLPGMRGPGRSVDSVSYNRRFLAALTLLERQGLPWGLIYVVTRRSLDRPLDVFWALTNLNPAGAINFNPVIVNDQARADLALTPDQYVGFLGAVHALWYPTRSRYPDVEPFSSIHKVLLEGGVEDRPQDVDSAQARELLIEPDGSAFCSRFPADAQPVRVGHLGERPLKDLADEARRHHAARQRSASRTAACETCRLWAVCRGGYAMDAFSQYEEITADSQWCHARKQFIEQHVEPLTGRRFPTIAA